MNKTLSLVSVIIPAKNRAILLIETLKSLLAQTYKNWEAIVIDDRSQEDVLEPVKVNFGDDPRIHAQTRINDRNGAQVCRNEAIELARGKYIIFLDSDDLLTPFCLEQRTEIMEKHLSIDFAVFPTLLFHKTPGDSRMLWNIIETKEPDVERFLKQDMPWQTTGPIWRKTVIHKLGKWDETLTSFQDWEYHLRACIIGLKYKKFDEPDCFYRMPDETDSIGSQYFKLENILSRIAVFKKASSLFTENRNMSTHIRRQFVGLFIRNMVQLLDQNMQPEAEMFFQAGCESEVLRSNDRLLAQNILKNSVGWRHNRLTKWWSRWQWSKSIRFDYWNEVSFCSCEANQNCRALQAKPLSAQLTNNPGEVYD